MEISRTAADSHEIRGLTGIRGFAAIQVVMFHYYGIWVLLFPSLHLLSRPISRGYLGVDMFFILSGFILSYVYTVTNKKVTLPDYGKFLLFRLARIYPNHLAMLLLLVVMVWMAPMMGTVLGGRYPFGNLPFQLTLTQSWPISPEPSGLSWNYPAWTLSAEWFAYLAIFPIVSFLLYRLRSSTVALFFGFTALISWSICCHFMIVTDEFDLSGYQGWLRVSCEFFAGGMFFGVFFLGNPLVILCQRFLSFFFGILILLLFSPPSFWVESGILLISPLLLLGLTSEESIVARLFSTKPALWLGRVSFALYMSHGVAIKIIKVLLPVSPYVHASMVIRALILSCQLGVVIVMTIGLYYLVEIPGRNFLRKMWLSRIRGSSTLR